MSDVLVRIPRVLPAPDPNPPYDAFDVPWTGAPHVADGQGVLPLRFPASLARDELARRAKQPPNQVEYDVEERSRVLARAVADALSGVRALEQLRYGFSGNAHRRLALAVRLSTSRYVVTTTHVRPVGPRAVEVAATLRGADHSHLMAMRLEIRHDRWLCTALDTGFLPRQR